jgi:3-oxoacyl-[acyl-carrier protein] reductase
MNLVGKTVLVTGGSRGLGRQFASTFKQAGSKVLVIARTTEDIAQNDPLDSNERWYTSWYSGDLQDSREIVHLTETILDQHGGIDILINNAGYGGKLAKLEETDLEEFRLHIGLNIVAPFLLMKNLLPSMLVRDESWIINIASQAGKRAVPKLGAYSATKFAMVGLTQTLAKELQGTNVNCVTICPAGMDTDMRSQLFGEKDRKLQQSPRDIARVVQAVVTQEIPVINGAEILIKDGRIQRIERSPDY